MHNKVLTVQLSSSQISEEKIDDAVITRFLGGRGLGVKLFIDHVPLHVTALAPENVLVYATGPLTATTVPTSGRSSLVTKSPLTHTILYSNTGGYVGSTFKTNGYDALLIQGALEDPGYVVIDGNDGSTLKAARELWGLNTRETMQELKKREGENIHALLIGQAGEHQVLLSSIMNDGDRRAFGRGGPGAVMGSKNLKAIVFKPGNHRAAIADRQRLQTYVKSAVDKINMTPITQVSLPKFGTSALINIINELGMLPNKNFQEGFSEHAEAVSGEAIREKIFRKKEGCYGCPIQCGRLTKAGNMEGKGPEYETAAMLGPNLGVYDLQTVTHANYLCNLYGLDTISTGGTLACAMELQQKGVLNIDELTFGNRNALPSLIKKIAFKEGIGKDLAQGSKRLAERYDHPETAMEVKGLEVPAYDPRGAKGHALGYATSNRGACHLTGYLVAMEVFAAPKKIPRHTTMGKADLLILKQHQSAVEDSLVVCKFASWALGFDFYARFAKAVTGVDFNVSTLMEIGERIYTLEHLFNLREGFTAAEDTLPSRFLEEPLTDGPATNTEVPLRQMLNEYYAARKWSAEGMPTQEKLSELGLSKLEGM
ncbi:MAG: aldehyde ferredoxin oxidoreductase [Candidatus Thorarchaeota archaeon]|nr:aldehyde ferredoxin oxidoreductase [Candidatus Thorarchaeota archaeon]NIW12619.1 aldehyde ferredoxin oxidoreductase [Candidatus Thorarchaeota archaeon]NIW50830.1 aldehyde ferredoxin oxidoreductase [Candidatus Korarchaeota archaeon]